MVRATDAASDVRYFLAGTVPDVIEAWQLVYRVYRRSGLVKENEFGLHTVPQAVGPHTAVMLGMLGEQLVSTISAYTDSDRGLPLDSVFPEALDKLRGQGQRLVEVGLFADRRKELGRSIDAVLGTMRYAFFYALSAGADSIVIGVHPHHARFYERLVAFDPISDVRSYSTVCDNPVILLQLDLARKLPRTPRYRGLSFFMEDPVAPDLYKARIHLTDDAIVGTPLEAYRVGGRDSAAVRVPGTQSPARRAVNDHMAG